MTSNNQLILNTIRIRMLQKTTLFSFCSIQREIRIFFKKSKWVEFEKLNLLKSLLKLDCWKSVRIAFFSVCHPIETAWTFFALKSSGVSQECIQHHLHLHWKKIFETVVVVTVVAVVVINNGVVAHQAFEGDDSVNDIFMLVVDV